MLSRWFAPVAMIGVACSVQTSGPTPLQAGTGIKIDSSNIISVDSNTASAADSAKLGGVSAASFQTATQADAKYLLQTAQALDSAKLGGMPAASFQTATQADAKYLSQTAQAIDSAKLGGVAASSFQTIAQADGRYVAQGNAALVPPGSVVAFAGPNPPAGWLLCDGGAVSRTTYASLFAAIGTVHGSGDSVSTFNLPDYRGRFLRGQDRGTGRDPDAASRAAMNAGGNIGDRIGSLEGDATHMPGNPFVTTVSGAHTHQYLRPNHRFGNQSGSNTTPWVIAEEQYGTTGQPEGTPEGAHSHAIIGGDSETRPVNAYVNFIIKY